MGASTVTAGNVGQWGGKDTRMERVLGRYSALTIELNRGVLIGGRGEWRVVRAHVENRGGQMPSPSWWIKGRKVHFPFADKINALHRKRGPPAKIYLDPEDTLVTEARYAGIQEGECGWVEKCFSFVHPPPTIRAFK